MTSPNFDSRDGHVIDMLVLHYTGMRSANEALERLCNPVSKVSAHYMVDEDGTVHTLVDEGSRAWHAGVSFWRGNTNINQRSIGIEIVNPGHEFGYRPFPKAQMEALAELCKAILSRHPIPARNVVAHSDVAPGRKEDPGELFDWRWLAANGVGLWPTDDRRQMTGDRDCDPSSVHRHLSSYGYNTQNLSAAITAFQRHFRPKLLNGLWDSECSTLLSCLLDSKL
jgi:N-acetylmuramoyl-L-alanine amidase